jgi:hypothetical protein
MRLAGPDAAIRRGLRYCEWFALLGISRAASIFAAI